MLRILITFVLLLPINSQAFTFDVWPSGTTKAESVQIAEANGINLTEQARSHDLRNKVSANEMNYSTPFFRNHAKVTLVYTRQTNLLYAVKVLWTNLPTQKANHLKNQLLSALEKKYGDFDVTSARSLIIDKGKKCKGSAKNYKNKNFEDVLSLSLSDCFNWLTLNYVNTPLMQQHVEESKATDEDRL